MALDRSAPRTRPEDLPAGPRRLSRIVFGAVKNFPTRSAAQKAWKDACAKTMHVTELEASASVKIEVLETDEGWQLQGLVHPARYHWSRVLEHIGARWKIAPPGLEWYKIPARTEEEILAMPKSNLGRYWP